MQIISIPEKAMFYFKLALPRTYEFQKFIDLQKNSFAGSCLTSDHIILELTIDVGALCNGLAKISLALNVSNRLYIDLYVRRFRMQGLLDWLV